MGLSRMSAYEIQAAYPDDIKTGAYKDKATGKFGGIISRGPLHNYKLIASTTASFDTEIEATAAMCRIVDGVVKEKGWDLWEATRE